MIAFIVPQVFTAWAYINIVDLMKSPIQVEIKMIDVKLFRIVTGEEIVAELISETEDTVTVKNGLVVIPSAQNVGFAPLTTVINREKPEITLSRNHIVYIAELDSSIESKYNEIYGSKLVTPEEKKLIL